MQSPKGIEHNVIKNHFLAIPYMFNYNPKSFNLIRIRRKKYVNSKSVGARS